MVDADRTQTKVVITERVSTFGTFSADNFTVDIGGVSYAVQKVSSFEQSPETQETTFVITHPSILEDVSATLSYRADADGGIADAVGNTLESFSRRAISSKSFVVLSLDEKDDTGSDTRDGVTTFDGDEVTVHASINIGTFSNGDEIKVYKRGASSGKVLKSVLVSNAIANAVDADGETSFEIVLPKSVFTIGEKTTFYAIYTPVGGTAGERGHEMVIWYRPDAPGIIITPLSDTPEQSKTVRARSENVDGDVWVYKVMKADALCDADSMAEGTTSYKEGSGLQFSKERANGYKICFASTDTIGNTSYAASPVIRGIDRTAPLITVSGPEIGTADEKIVRATDDDAEGSTVWKFRVVRADSTCDENSMSANVNEYRETSGLVFRKRKANGYKVCFSSTDTAGNVAYTASRVIDGLGTGGSIFGSVPSQQALQATTQ